MVENADVGSQRNSVSQSCSARLGVFRLRFGKSDEDRISKISPAMRNSETRWSEFRLRLYRLLTCDSARLATGDSGDSATQPTLAASAIYKECTISRRPTATRRSKGPHLIRMTIPNAASSCTSVLTLHAGASTTGVLIELTGQKETKNLRC